MSEIKEAVAGLKTLLVQFQAIQKVSDALETIGSIEKAHTDSVVAINHYRKMESDAQQGAISAQSKLDAVIKQVRQAEELRKKTLMETEQKKREIIENAEKESSQIIKDANKASEGIEEAFREKRTDLAVLENEIVKKTQELEAIKLETKRLKDQLASFIGNK